MIYVDDLIVGWWFGYRLLWFMKWKYIFYSIWRGGVDNFVFWSDMMSEFVLLGDGIGSFRNIFFLWSFNDYRFYLSLFFLDDEIEDDNMSEFLGDSEVRVILFLVRLKNLLFFKKEYVDKLRLEEIWWFYK